MEDIEMQDSNLQAKPKKNSPLVPAQTLKKLKEIKDIGIQKLGRINLWFKFAAIEELAKDVGIMPIDKVELVDEFVMLGFLESKAHKMESTTNSFLHAKQKLWPYVWLDKIPSQQFHLTQLPFDIEIDAQMDLAMIYNIFFYFLKSQTYYLGEYIINATRKKLDRMKIALGSIV